METHRMSMKRVFGRGPRRGRTDHNAGTIVRALLGPVLVALTLGGSPLAAQQPAEKPAPQPAGGGDAGLAQQLTNPVAALVSVPAAVQLGSTRGHRR